MNENPFETYRQFIETALVDIEQAFGFQQYTLWSPKRTIEWLGEQKSLTEAVKKREGITDWRTVTPLGGPGTVLNAAVLYTLITHLHLYNVTETGVSGGFYTIFLLHALQDHQGLLTSLELEDNDKVAHLVPANLRGYRGWHLHKGTDSLKFLKDDPKVSVLYCHDSLHTMSHMLKELEQFKKCQKDKFIIFIDDQDTDKFWQRCLSMGAFQKPGYSVKWISGNESRLKGHLGGFLYYVKN